MSLQGVPHMSHPWASKGVEPALIHPIKMVFGAVPLPLSPMEQAFALAPLADVSSHYGPSMIIDETNYSPTYSEFAVYDFEIDPQFIGKFVGRNGRNIQHFQQECGVQLHVKPHPFKKSCKIVKIQGRTENIYKALIVIREKFNSHQNPSFFLTKFNIEPQLFPVSLMPRVGLNGNCNTEVLIAKIISPGCFYVYNYRHRSHNKLLEFSRRMEEYYQRIGGNLPIYTIVEGGVACAYYDDKPRRVEVIRKEPSTRMCLVRYLDFGGYDNVPYSQIKELPQEFIHYPIQAIECALYGIQPLEGESYWSSRATEVFSEIVNSHFSQVSVKFVDLNNLCYVELCRLLPKTDRSLMVNYELVRQDVARRYIPENELAPPPPY